MAAKPSVENNLTATSELCSLYGSLASLYRVSGRPDLAGPVETRRLALWTNWDRKLPKNPFILRRARPYYNGFHPPRGRAPTPAT